MGLKVVVTGAGGRLGRELLGAFPAHEVVGLDHAALDVADGDAVLARRPADSVLDNAVLRLSGVPLLPDFRASLPRLVESLA